MTMLELLSFKRSNVFDVHMSDDHKILTITEACDNWYKRKLNKKDVKLLIEEFTELHRTMT